MQFNNLIVILATAMTAAALPQPGSSGIAVRTNPSPPPQSCTSSSVNVCCIGIIPILCNIVPLGTNCGSSSYCCTTDSHDSGNFALINLELSCLKLL